MRISVNAGHTAGGAGYGAVYKGFRESDITREVVAALLPKIPYQKTPFEKTSNGVLNIYPSISSNCLKASAKDCIHFSNASGFVRSTPASFRSSTGLSEPPEERNLK